MSKLILIKKKKAMLGNPKYALNEEVSFKLYNSDNVEVMKHGIIYIVDDYGTFEDNSDVSYDIFVHDENCLYKHVREDSVMYSLETFKHNK